MKALSVRPPWAHAIIYCGKNVENRSWSTQHRGPLLIHASGSCTRAEYEAAQEATGGQLPPFGELARGGLVGAVRLTSIAASGRSVNRWHVAGEFGWRLASPVALKFRPLKGRLSLFQVELKPAEIAALARHGLLP